MTSVSAALSSSVVSATGVSYTVSFTVPTGGVITNNGKIKLTFPAGFNVASAGAGTLTGIDGTVVASVSGQDVTLTRQNNGTNSTAGVKSVVITGIVNHATATDTYTITGTTQTSANNLLATAATAAYLINPAAISALTCEVSGQSDAVWLRWTTPLGTTGGYEVKYELGSSITYGSATTFTQSWASGTVATSQQQLLTGLTNAQYTFAIKAKGANTSLSAISNTPNCTLATSSSSSAIEKIAPAIQVTSPTMGSTVQSGKDLKVTGTAKDTGGSSVQKVEVSVNGGNWVLAKISGADDLSNVTWEYTIPAASVPQGEISIKVRGTDWVNNVSASTTITVTGGTVTTTTTPTTTTTTPTTTVAPQTQAELKASLETQLKDLLIKLIELLTAEINRQLGL